MLKSTIVLYARVNSTLPVGNPNIHVQPHNLPSVRSKERSRKNTIDAIPFNHMILSFFIVLFAIRKSKIVLQPRIEPLASNACVTDFIDEECNRSQSGPLSILNAINVSYMIEAKEPNNEGLMMHHMTLHLIGSLHM